jgi:hypothetical protein
VNQNATTVLTSGSWNSNNGTISITASGSWTYPVNGVVHAPSGGTGPPANGSFVQVSGGSNVYEIVGGAPLYVSSWVPFGGPQPTTPITQTELEALPPVPSNDTFVETAGNQKIFVIAGGAPLVVTNCANLSGGCGTPIDIDPWDIANAGASLSGLNLVSSNGTVVEGLPSTRYWMFESGGLEATAASPSAVQVDDASLAGFPLDSPPTVTSISPTSGPTAGGTTVTVTGTGFTGATVVDLGVDPASSFTVVSSTRLTFVTPKQTAGLHNVTVTGPTGTSADVSGDLYTDLSPPAVTSISPTAGLPAGGNTVTITGSGFTGATAVDLGVVAATSFTVVSNTQITFVTPKQTAGLHNVTVTGPTGTSADVSGDLYTDS